MLTAPISTERARNRAAIAPTTRIISAASRCGTYSKTDKASCDGIVAFSAVRLTSSPSITIVQ